MYRGGRSVTRGQESVTGIENNSVTVDMQKPKGVEVHGTGGMASRLGCTLGHRDVITK